MSLMVTLLARLYYVQLLDPNKPVQTAHLLHDGVIVVPAPRGLIVDARGRPLVANTSAQVITVDRDLLQQRPDKGEPVLRRLAMLFGRDETELTKEITPCSPTVPAPCWTGYPYEPVPVATDASAQVVFAISEHREQFPGVAVRTVTIPQYPHGSLAAQILGYTSEITEADKNRNPTLTDADTIGVSGLEEQYDAVLRGVDGQQLVQLNPQGYTVRLGSSTPAQQGNTLVTSIDLDLQRLAEQSLAQQIRDSQAAGNAAPGGAVVIMNPNTGRILAVASYPTYDPTLFVGGISTADYQQLLSPAAGTPLLNRAIAGEYAPGSTFKIIMSAALLGSGLTPSTPLPCSNTINVFGKTFKNYDALRAYGNGTMQQAFNQSCNTAFISQHARLPKDGMTKAAAMFGIGRDLNLSISAYGGQVPAPKDDVEEAASMIGQGTVTASPLAMALVGAAVDHGTAMKPVLVPGKDAAGAAASPLPAATVAALRTFMRTTVTGGTAKVLAGNGAVAAKTGTAEVVVKGKVATNAWMAGYRGDVAFAVIVEGGESGSHTAGPILKTFLSSFK